MTGPVPDADAAEQRRTPIDDTPGTEPPEVRGDTPEADVLEQAQPVAPGEHRVPREASLEADDADADEQAVVVPLDEDEGRI